MPAHRTIAIAGATAAAIIGVGTAALATTGSSAPGAASAAPAAAAAHHHVRHHRHPLRRALRRHAVRGEIVTHTKKHGYVVHSAIRGTVQDVSSTAITVKAPDGVSQTFTVAGATHVRDRVPGHRKGKPSTIGDVQSGDLVGVVGKAPESSSADPTATLVVDRTAH